MELDPRRSDPPAREGAPPAEAGPGSILQDWSANAGNPKSQLVLAGFRLAQRVWAWPPGLRWLGWPYLGLYRVAVEWLLGIELHWKLRVGPGLRLFHGAGLVVNPDCVIGARCVLRHTTTIGRASTAAEPPGGLPQLGDGVDVGPHAVILGPVRIGDGAVIGAGAVVTRDVPPGAVVAGNPARVISERRRNGERGEPGAPS